VDRQSTGTVCLFANHSTVCRLIVGIYAVKAETDFSQDPVLLGLLTEDDLSRLLAL